MDKTAENKSSLHMGYSDEVAVFFLQMALTQTIVTIRTQYEFLQYLLVTWARGY